MKKKIRFLLCAIGLTGLMAISDTKANFLMQPIINKLDKLAKGSDCPLFCTKRACANTTNPHDYALCALMCPDKKIIEDCLSVGKKVTEKAFGTSDPKRLLARGDAKPDKVVWLSGKKKMCAGSLCNDKTCANAAVKTYCSAICHNVTEGKRPAKKCPVNYGDMMAKAKKCQAEGWSETFEKHDETMKE